MEYAWDEHKRQKVKDEHKVDFDKLTDVFDDVFSLDYVDEEHSTGDEERIVIVGKTVEYGLILLVYAVQNENRIHFITARRAEKWLVQRYEENL